MGIPSLLEYLEQVSLFIRILGTGIPVKITWRRFSKQPPEQLPTLAGPPLSLGKKLSFWGKLSESPDLKSLQYYLSYQMTKMQFGWWVKIYGKELHLAALRQLRR